MLRADHKLTLALLAALICLGGNEIESLAAKNDSGKTQNRATDSQTTEASRIIDHSCVDYQDKIIPLKYLQAGQKLKCFFGHQSVGWNILDGLENLANKDPKRYAINLNENAGTAWFKENAGIAHAAIGENGNPQSKIHDFAQKLSKSPGYGGSVDMAMMKLCFVDITGDSDPKKVWTAYSSTMQALKVKFPKLKLVFCSCPIVCNEDNSKREIFNKLLREHCKKSGDFLFDLADIEAFTPQGAPCSHNSQAALCKIYSEDGEHPDSPAGKQRMARAWWWMMARLAGWDGKRAI